MEITVWLPEEQSVALMGGLPDGFRADVWAGSPAFPDSAGDVEIVVPSFDARDAELARLRELPRLKVVQLESVGVDWVRPHIPDGVILCNARGAYDKAVAEWVVAVALSHYRNLPAFERARQLGTWDFAHTGTLEGKTALIVGFGSIGSELASMLHVFGVDTIGVARTARDGVHGVDELPDLLPRADLVVLTLPGTAASRHLVDTRFLGTMRDGALLVNAGRGEVVDTDALLAELQNTRLFAALDVTDPEPLPDGHPLWRAPGLQLTPHVAGSNGTAMAKAMRLTKAQLIRYAAGETLLNVVGPDGY
jgi:phosphoglycerate dehydrogenase-like enzyme